MVTLAMKSTFFMRRRLLWFGNKKKWLKRNLKPLVSKKIKLRMIFKQTFLAACMTPSILLVGREIPG